MHMNASGRGDPHRPTTLSAFQWQPGLQEMGEGDKMLTSWMTSRPSMVR
jgi:hypothetical protein